MCACICRSCMNTKTISCPYAWNQAGQQACSAMHLMGLDPTAVAGAVFEAAVKGARAVAPIANPASAGRGSGCSASGWGAQQGKRCAGFMRVAMRVHTRCTCAWGLRLSCAWVAVT